MCNIDWRICLSDWIFSNCFTCDNYSVLILKILKNILSLSSGLLVIHRTEKSALTKKRNKVKSIKNLEMRSKINYCCRGSKIGGKVNVFMVLYKVMRVDTFMNNGI